MPDLDRTKFAFACAAKLHALGVDGPRGAQRKFPSVRAATWSRLGHAHPLSDANIGAVCKVLDLDIRDYVLLEARNPKDMHRLKAERKQRVARMVSRETLGCDEVSRCN